MIKSLLFGLAAFLLAELAILCLRRFTKAFRAGLLFHLSAVVAGSWAALEQTAIPDLDPTWWKVFCTGAFVLFALTLFALFDILVLSRPWKPKDGPMMPRLVRDVLRLLLALAVGLIAATQLHNLPLPAVLASSTVVSAIVALAFQDVLKNISAGMAIQIEGWLKVGDWLLIDGEPAVVTEMSWHSTRLRTNEGVELLEPNTRFVDQRLINYGTGQRPVAFGFKVGLPYETPPARVKEVLGGAARQAPGVLAHPAPVVLLRDYGESSIVYELRVWTREVHHIAQFQDTVGSRIWYEIQRAGLYVPFPIRTVHFRQLDRAEAVQQQQQVERASHLLARVELFRNLEPEKLSELAKAARKQHYGHGEQLVQEGDPGDSLFLVDRGKVLISKAGSELGTGSVRLATLEEGSFFGEHSLLTGEPRNATVAADGGCEVLVLEKNALAPLLEADPSLAEKLSRALTERGAATEAVLAERQEKHRLKHQQHDQASILKRIRAFFRLGQDANG